MRYEGCFSIECVGHKGGLGVLWRSKDVAQVDGFSKWHVDLLVILKDEMPYRMTLFYGYADRNERHKSWSLLRQLAASSALPWVILGDFNELLYMSEKKGCLSHRERLILAFREAVEDCGSEDLGYSRHPYTWEKWRGTRNWVEERLDRTLSNRAWRNQFGLAKVSHVPQSTSNHLPIFL